jgi:hypothetical protein
MKPCVDHGPTGYCASGRHASCPYSPGGACEGGIVVPECWVAFPPRGGGFRGAVPKPDNMRLAVASEAVIRPSHVSVCGCGCHTGVQPVAQLELFGARA